VLAVVLVASAAAGHAEEDTRTYAVRVGDTLWQIAGEVFGDHWLWPALYLANRDQIKDPSRVYPGQELLVPDVDPAERETLRDEAEALLK